MNKELNIVNEENIFFKYNIMAQDKYIIVNKKTILLIDIQRCIKNRRINNMDKDRNRDKVVTTFGIKNDNFSAISTDKFFEREELLNLFDLLEKIVKNQLIEKEVSFLNERLKFDFWIDGKKQYLDISFEFIEKENDFYSLALEQEDIKSLYSMLYKQINKKTILSILTNENCLKF